MHPNKPLSGFTHISDGRRMSAEVADTGIKSCAPNGCHWRVVKKTRWISGTLLWRREEPCIFYAKQTGPVCGFAMHSPSHFKIARIRLKSLLSSSPC